MMNLKKTLLHAAGLAALLSFSGVTFSQTSQGFKQTSTDETQDNQDNKDNKEWDVLNPSFDLTTVSIDTEQTTWSS